MRRRMWKREKEEGGGAVLIGGDGSIPLFHYLVDCVASQSKLFRSLT